MTFILRLHFHILDTNVFTFLYTYPFSDPIKIKFYQNIVLLPYTTTKVQKTESLKDRINNIIVKPLTKPTS